LNSDRSWRSFLGEGDIVSPPHSLEKKMLRPLFAAAVALLIVLVVASQISAQRSSRTTSLPVQVHGQVRYSVGGAPVDHALVRLQSFRGGVVAELTTDRTGKFIFTGLVPDQYTVVVRLPGFKEEQRHVDLNTTTSEYVLVELSSDSSPATSRHGSPKIVSVKTSPEAQGEFDKGRAELIDNKNIDGGILHLEKAVALSPNFFEAHLLLGTAYVEKHQLDKAKHALLRAIEINPTAAEPQVALGEVYRQQKRYPDAEKTLAAAIKLSEKSALAHLTLARVYWDLGLSAGETESKSDFEKSWQEVNVAMRLNPDLPQPHLLAGNLLFKARRAKDALPEYETYLRLDPNGEFAAQTREMVQKIKRALAEPKVK
jgi:cytochrome c-type biogenesis protein CcmH/NrfG